MGFSMKRIAAACITQTLHFKCKEGDSSEYAKRAVAEEVRRYKEGLQKAGTKHKILWEEVQPDGSVIMELKKQYNMASVGNYLDE